MTFFFFFQAEDGIRDGHVTGVQTCALPISIGKNCCTNQRGLLCTAVFADCVPLLFFDPVTSYIGIAHAGWRGTVKGIGRQMVKIMLSKGVDVKNIKVCIGPSISRDHYMVDCQVIEHISACHRSTTEKDTDNDQYLLDLKQLNVEMILQSG